GHLAIGTRRARRRLPAAVDPRRRNPELSRRRHVVKIALRGVEPPRTADTLPRCEEVGVPWFVRPHLLRGDDRLERNAEMPARAGEQVVVHIREDAETVASRREALQRPVRVRERWPSRQAVREKARP